VLGIAAAVYIYRRSADPQMKVSAPTNVVRK
jgi:hypothetical protein